MSAQTQMPEVTSSVDPEEIAQFSAIAAEWWDPHGKFKPLHEINPLRIGYIKRHICQQFERDEQSLTPFNGLSLLDIGCGGGLICEPMARLGATVTGIDASEKNVQVASVHAEETGTPVTYHATTAEELVLEDNRYDVVLALEIVEHVTDPDAFTRSCAALVKPGGLMVMSTINRTPQAFVKAIVGAEYILQLLPKGTHQWRKFVKPSEMSMAMHQGGLLVKEMRGMVLNPLKWEWGLSDKDLSVNYLMVGQKPAK